MKWAKLPCGWSSEAWVDAAAMRYPRGEVLAAWAELLTWSVAHETDGRVPVATAARVIGAALGVGGPRARRILEAITDAGALETDQDSVAFRVWNQADSGELRVKSEQNRMRKQKSRSNDSEGLGQMSRCDIAPRLEKTRLEKTREDKTHTATQCADRAPARADTPPAAARNSSSTEGGLPEDTRKILAELQRHPKLAPIASPELASVLDGRRIGSGATLADVARAIGDAVAHADEGLAAAPLRRMVVGYCDHARNRGRAKVAPAQSEVPIERAWYPNQGLIEGWAKQPVTQAELDHIERVFGPGPWDSDKAGVKAGAA